MCACVFIVFYYVFISIAVLETCVIKLKKGIGNMRFQTEKGIHFCSTHHPTLIYFDVLIINCIQ